VACEEAAESILREVCEVVCALSGVCVCVRQD
jgi:hypothetical protein